RLNEQQTITLTDFADRDVIGYAVQDGQICIQVFYIRQGKMIARDHFVFSYIADPEDAFATFVAQFYTQGNRLIPKEILLPQMENPILADVLPVRFPQRGRKRKLLDLAEQNAQTFLQDTLALAEKTSAQSKSALQELSAALRIPYPQRIECFDISNLGPSNAVAGLVQFIAGLPQRDGYRKFKIQTDTTTFSDTAALYQVIERRMSRLQKESAPYPDLLLIDGGKGQIRAAREALTRLGIDLPIAGLVKNDRHQTESLLDASGQPVPIGKNTPLFHFLEQVQNEVHRFAVTFHRQQRNKRMTESQLETIPGVGPKRRQALMIHFKTLDRLRAAEVDDLIAAGIPHVTARNIYLHFHPDLRPKE
ncbi:MAG: excinuclease ABC subunit UvrC, partial [Peptococcaceae bacterium]|nr:excinuclease ABC subunit UvrC [Peptococcaceae bacterium]